MVTNNVKATTEGRCKKLQTCMEQSHVFGSNEEEGVLVMQDERVFQEIIWKNHTLKPHPLD